MKFIRQEKIEWEELRKLFNALLTKNSKEWMGHPTETVYFSDFNWSRNPFTLTTTIIKVPTEFGDLVDYKMTEQTITHKYIRSCDFNEINFGELQEEK